MDRQLPKVFDTRDSQSEVVTLTSMQTSSVGKFKLKPLNLVIYPLLALVGFCSVFLIGTLLIPFVPFLKGFLSEVFGSRVGTTFTTMLPYVGMFLPIVVVFVHRLYGLPPTHIYLSSWGFRAIRSSVDNPTIDDSTFASGFGSWIVVALGGPLGMAKFSWDNLESIKTAPVKEGPASFVFEMKNGKSIKLKLADLLGQETKEQFLSVLNSYAPHVVVEKEIYELLSPAPQSTYTELWLSALSAPGERKSITTLSEGTTIGAGKYVVIRQLSMGGQATAYLCNADGKRVIIKEYILPVQVNLSSRMEAIRSLEDEAKLLTRLNHPGVVKLLDFFIEDHRGYLVYEEILGSNLRQLVTSKGPLSEQEVVKLAIGVCDVLTYIHDQSPSIVHRDISPENLMLSDDGTIKLIDFNVACENVSTAKNNVVGKHQYIPPEQFRGSPSNRSDLYAFGATLYFLLAGEDPLPISVSHLSQRLPDCNRRLDEIVAQLTQPEESQRFATAADVKKALESVSENQ